MEMCKIGLAGEALYYYTLLYWGEGTESVPRREEGSTGKYQHEVEGVPEGAARGNSRDRHYPICKSDEAVAIAIAIAIAIA